jgi:CDP-glucose 4,6-dehydratase
MSFSNTYRGKRVMITGNTGFKGAWLASWLMNLGAEVYGLSISVPTTPSLFEVLGHRSRLRYWQQDVTELGRVCEIFDSVRPDFVFHLAAQPLVRLSYQDPTGTFRTNVIGTTNVLEALRLANQPCIAIFITSDKAYDNVEWVWGYRENDALGGKDPYSASKGAAELVIRSYSKSYFELPSSRVRVATGRAGNVIGGGDWAADRIVPDAMRAWSQGLPVEIRSAQATRPWQHVLEPLSGYLALAQQLASNPQLNGEAFNFGPNAENNFTVAELLSAMQPAWPGSEWRKVPCANDAPKEAILLKLNCDKALQLLRWAPTLSFTATAQMVTEWYRRYYDRQDGLWEYTTEQIAEFEERARAKQLAWAKG